MEFDDETELGLDITQTELMSILPIAVLQRLAPEPSGKWHLSKVGPNEFRAEYVVKRLRDRIIASRHTISTVLSVAEVHDSFPVHRARALDQAQTDAILPQIEHLVHQPAGNTGFIPRANNSSSAQGFQEDELSGFPSITTSNQTNYFSHSQSYQNSNGQETTSNGELPVHNDLGFFNEDDFTTAEMLSNDAFLQSGNNLENHTQNPDAIFSPTFPGASTSLTNQAVDGSGNFFDETDLTDMGLQWNENEAMVSPAAQNTSAAILQSIEFSQNLLSGNQVVNPFSERMAQFQTSVFSSTSQAANQTSFAGIPFMFHAENMTTTNDSVGKKYDTTETGDPSHEGEDI
ncbi:hypothetical protein SODALDRAFT_126637 [Sodiomyces alkalinus F11]|uniref:Uncharacterized protein n=1 Tax=Sodiomyces alkalinus (strain CBS 110278 / VKM F-3762 / F11) TaxID=1314773 RepID=A0A3N2Q4L1_SODAK|nr:hypothetical protein SODALDRAFT_126637 [Sodiomyces alkalinus F11]ROT41701.1 hypothetical protein SODALDRAFT_126637 [Sodiomyces alkalinus F11]